MPTPTKENYLKAVFFLSQKNQQISITALANKMKVSKPTANNMVKKMEQNNWLLYEKYKPLELTQAGKKMGALIVKTVENKSMGIKAGIEFKVGSGFTDVMRDKELYPIGTKITFKYGEMTKTGKPRFPIFDRVCSQI